MNFKNRMMNHNKVKNHSKMNHSKMNHSKVVNYNKMMNDNKMMNYIEAMDYIERLNKAGSIYGLERIRELVSRLGNPEKDLKIIHIAGTNGKGSFGAFLGSILAEAGYKAGRYISPVIEDYCERIQINGQWISSDAVADILTEIRYVCETMQRDGFEYPTVFEIETAMAFVYFKRMNVDFVLLEAGLGGLLDSTNVIEKSILSVITSIGLDHTAVLGDSIAQIARQKSGIIKNEQDVLTYPQPADAMDIIKQQCHCCESPLTVCRWDHLNIKIQSLEGQMFDYKDLQDLWIQSAGAYQIYNAAAAIEAAFVLIKQGFVISRQAIYDGLKAAKWPGRFEVIGRQPLIIVDGAHNPDGARYLGDSIARNLKGREVVYVAGIFADKAYKEILEILSPYAETIFTHKPPTNRGLETQLLADAAKCCYKNVKACENISDALKLAIEAAGKDGAVVAFGSLSTIKGLKEAITASICGNGI